MMLESLTAVLGAPMYAKDARRIVSATKASTYGNLEEAET